jgi:long-chain fatty acid transport protein
MRRYQLTLVLALAALLAAPPVAQAGGFLTRFANEESMPTTDSPAAAYYNPAGLAMHRGTHFSLEAGLGYRSTHYDRSPDAIDHVLQPGDTGAGTPADAVAANSGAASLSNAVFLPFAGASSDLGVPNLGVGLAVFVPFGGTAGWSKNAAYQGNQSYPGAVDGPQRWAVIEGESRSIYVTAAGAYRIPAAHLSVGVGVNVVMSTVNFLRARNVSGTDDVATGSGQLLEGRSLVDVSGTDLSLGAGLMFEPTPRLRLGLAYQSQPGLGEQKLSGTLTNKFGTAETTVTDISMVQSLPDVVRAGVRYLVNDRFELRGEAELQRWSRFDKQCFLDRAVDGANCALNDDGSSQASAKGIVANIPRQWKDSYGVRAGASYWVAPRVRVMGSINYDTSPVPDAMLEASLPDMNKLVVGAGARLVVGHGLDVVAYWMQVFYFDRTTGKAAPLMTPSRVPSGAGRYQQSVGVLQLALDYGF